MDRGGAKHGRCSRRALLLAAGAAALLGRRAGAQDARWFDPATSPLGMALSEAQLGAGVRFLQRFPSIDVHCHPGRFFLRGETELTPRLQAYGAPFEDKAVADMHSGQVSGAVFAGVADMSLLEFSPERGMYATREFAPGEAWADYRRQVGVLRGLVAAHRVARGETPRDLRLAQRRHETACIFSIEGGDFIEDRLDRVHQAHADGVRAITVVHYHVNQIGDIQTAPARHGGLTKTGAAIVREMNKAGIIVDLAHAPLSVTRGAVEVVTRPMMISHTNLTSPQSQHPRLISLEHAKLVTAAGGVIGSVPSGIGQASFAQWIDAILRLVDGVGIDHVAIGTDMDANYMPVFTDYRSWPLIPAALLARGLAEAEVAKILGGNFLRLFAAVAEHG